MESDFIYVVIRSGGEFSDSWEEVIAATPDLAKCEAYVAQQKIDDIKYDMIVEHLHKFNHEYHVQNPYKGTPYELEKIPKWATGLTHKDITPEMRAERDAIIERNRQLVERRDEVWRQETAKEEAAKKEFLISIGVPDDQCDKYLDSGYAKREEDWKYSIKKIKVL